VLNCWQEVLAIVAAYGLGCVCTGYYLVRGLRGIDIRDYGSGSVGARNVGRVLGRAGFLVALLGDVGKGILAVSLARFLELETWGVVFVAVAVVAGHLWPLPLGGRGGKGIATSLGALVVLDYPLVIVVFAVCAVVYLLVKHLTVGGLFAYAMLPAASVILQRPATEVAGVVVLVLAVILAHRSNLVAILREAREGRFAKEDRRPAAKGVSE